jgi:hypothetical protein
MWDITVSQTTLYGSSCSMVEVLWKHFRNGIAHGIIIEKGGLDFTADNTPLGYLITTNNFLHIGPRTFIRNFNSSLLKYVDDVRNNVNGKRALFIQNFNRTYSN